MHPRSQHWFTIALSVSSQSGRSRGWTFLCSSGTKSSSSECTEDFIFLEIKTRETLVRIYASIKTFQGFTIQRTENYVRSKVSFKELWWLVLFLDFYSRFPRSFLMDQTPAFIPGAKTKVFNSLTFMTCDNYYIRADFYQFNMVGTLKRLATVVNIYRTVLSINKVSG